MSYLSFAVIALVALAHFWFLVLEMFLWQTPRGLKTFKMSAEQAKATATLAKNQGLYNGFLAAGLVWSLACAEPSRALELKTFFLGCVAVAGVYGAITVSRATLYVQTLPALIGLGLAWLGR